MCDLLWSDPEKAVKGWGENERGVSFVFGTDVVKVFLRKNDIDLICRAHQVRFFGFMGDRSWKMGMSSFRIGNWSHSSVRRTIAGSSITAGP